MVNIKGDPPLLMSITAITLAVLCMLSFYLLDMARLLSFDDEPIIYIEINGVILSQIDQIKLTLMFMSLVFDVYKWSIFLASTGL